MRKKEFFSLIAIFLYLNAIPNTPRFSHITTADGISQSEIFAFCEDKNGFMWFGTVDGLNRYDGYTIQIFNTDKDTPHSLSNNTVRSLVEDQMGRLWIGTDNGLNYYDHETELIYKVNITTDTEKIAVWSLLIYDNFILVGTNEGLWRASIISNNLEDIEKSFHKIKKVSNRLYSSNVIYSITSSKHGGIWIMSYDNISRIIFQPNKIEPVIIEDLDYIDFKLNIVAAEDPMGYLWIASKDNGLLRYDPENKTYQHVTNDDALINENLKKCSTLAFDHDGVLWAGTLDKGLVQIRFDYENEKIVDIRSIQNERDNLHGLNSNLIYSLYISGTNKLWVGTLGSGINIYDPDFKKFLHYKIKTTGNDNPNSNFIRAVLVDEQNRIWVGAHNNGLYLLDRKTSLSRKLGFDTESIFYIKKYAENQYFICTGSGISLVELKGSTFKVLSTIDVIQFPVFYVIPGRDNIYWCATSDGLVRFRVINNQILFDEIYNKTTQPALSEINCRVLFYDQIKNQILVGTEGGGVNYVILDDLYFPKEINVYSKDGSENSLSNNYVRSIIKDANNTFWIGTYEGLNKVVYDSVSGQRSFVSYTRKDGLPNNKIQLIVEDDKNYLWIGTNGGLSKFSPGENSFVNYNMADGLQSNEFSEHTVYRTQNGELFLGGINGISAFFPDEIITSELKPRPTITDFYLNNQRIKPNQIVDNYIPLIKSILQTDKLVLSPEHKNLGFTFTAMIYPNAGNVKYAYMLEGFDEDWNYTDASNRSANYTNLRHGKYVFKVKATNADGVWGDITKQVFIHIQTPFVYSWFAYLLYVLAILLIILYFSHFTIIRYTTKKNLLLEKEHGEKLHKLDEMRTQFFINISHDLRTPLTLISGPLESILKDKQIREGIRENLFMIKRNVKRLNYLVEQLLDVRKAESGKLTPKLQSVDLVSFTKEEMAHFSFAVKKKGLELTLTHNDEPLSACIDEAMISKVYFNIISNAIKYTKNGGITVSIEKIPKRDFLILLNGQFENYLKFEISDTGSGISKEHVGFIFERFYQDNQYRGNGYGIGLSHSKDLIEAHNGFIEVNSELNVGTVIRFFIPYVKIADNINPTTYASPDDIYIDVEEEIIVDTDFSFEKTILVVEDNADMLNYIKKGLMDNYNVLLANNGVEGLEIARSKMPDLIVNDVMMPIMDGIEFCKEIKTNLKTSHIPVILLTAKVDQKTKYDGIETGADDFIQKPFDMDYLLLRINNLLQSRENLRNLFQKNIVLEPSAVTVTSVDEQFLSTLLKAIEENISDEDFSVTTLESQLGMSHSSFYRKIKSLTGQSGQEILLNMRMKRARQMLLDDRGIRVSELANMVGFSNPNYFSKCFKEMFGISPSDLKGTEEQSR